MVHLSYLIGMVKVYLLRKMRFAFNLQILKGVNVEESQQENEVYPQSPVPEHAGSLHV